MEPLKIEGYKHMATVSDDSLKKLEPSYPVAPAPAPAAMPAGGIDRLYIPLKPRLKNFDTTFQRALEVAADLVWAGVVPSAVQSLMGSSNLDAQHAVENALRLVADGAMLMMATDHGWEIHLKEGHEVARLYFAPRQAAMSPAMAAPYAGVPPMVTDHHGQRPQPMASNAPVLMKGEGDEQTK